MFAEPKNAHEHYHDLMSYAETEILDCFMGGLQALDTFSRVTCPQIISHKSVFGETCAHLCTLCTDHRCSNFSENLPGRFPGQVHFMASFSILQTELVVLCS
jgi:hypothetical protein